MDQTNHQKLSSFTKSQFLKKLTKLLLSVSLFSLLFSTSGFLSFLQPWHFHLSTFPIRLLTHAIDKNCIFLLCNGILVFLAKNSGFIGTKARSHLGTSSKEPAKETLYTMENKSLATEIDDGNFPNVARKDFSLKEEGKILNYNDNNHADCVVEVGIGDVCFHVEGCAGDNNDDMKEEGQEDNIRSSTLEAGNSEDYDDGSNVKNWLNAAISDIYGDEELAECGGERDDGTSEYYDDGSNVMTEEELDKKFDEFIRRMKEGIMIEAQQQQQQLLMV